MKTKTNFSDRDFYRIRDLVRTLGLSKSKIHRLIAQGRLRAVRIDDCVLVPTEAYRKLSMGIGNRVNLLNSA